MLFFNIFWVGSSNFGNFFYYLLFFTFLLWSKTNAQVTGNPFKLENTPKVEQISSFYIDSWQAGSLKKPSFGVVHFIVKGHSGQMIPHLPPHLFKYYLKKGNQSWAIKGSTTFRSSQSPQYEARLKYPKVSDVGPYQLGIGLKSVLGNTDFLTEKKVFYQKDKINIVFVLDNSGSMSANDPLGSRLQAVLNFKKNRRLVEVIDKVGVVVFDSKPRVLIRMTSFTDLLKQKNKIDSLIPKGKTDVPAALKLAYHQLKKIGGTSAAVLLTDGVSSVSTVGSYLSFKKTGIPVYTIGLGSDTKSGKNNPEGFNQTYLKKIAEETGGIYFKSQAKALDSIYGRIIKDRFKSSDKMDFLLPKKHYLIDEYLSIHLKWIEKSPLDFVIKVDAIQVKPLRIIKSGNWHKVYLKPLTPGKRELLVSFFKNDVEIRQWKNIVEVEKKNNHFFTWKILSEQLKIVPSQTAKEGVLLTHDGNRSGFYYLETTDFVAFQNPHSFLPLEMIEFHPSFHLLEPEETKLLSIVYHYRDDPPAGIYFGNILIESDNGIFGFERELVIDHHISGGSKANTELKKEKKILPHTIIPILLIWLVFLMIYLWSSRSRIR